MATTRNLRRQQKATVAAAFAATLAAAVFAGYRQAPGESPEAIPGQYFAAIERRDCAALKRLTTGTLARDLEAYGCDDTIRRMKSHGIRYLGTSGRKPDGRDPQAQLVTIRLLYGHEPQPRAFQVRVQAQHGSWKLATM